MRTIIWAIIALTLIGCIFQLFIPAAEVVHNVCSSHAQGEGAKRVLSQIFTLYNAAPIVLALAVFFALLLRAVAREVVARTRYEEVEEERRPDLLFAGVR